MAYFRRALQTGRRVLKASLPPVVLDTWKARRQHFYSSFEEAKAASTGAWHSDTLTRFRIEEAVQNLPQLSSNHLPSGYALLLATLALSRVDKALICDVGGGCGAWGYRLAKDSARPFDYAVVEHEGLVAACRALQFFSWGSWLTQLPDEYDVLVCSGTLQYLDSPYDFLRRALARARHHAIIARTTFCERDYVQVQVSPLRHHGHLAKVPPGYDPNQLIHCPHRTLRQSEVLAIAADVGFDVHLMLHPAPSELTPRAFEQDMVLTRRAGVT